MTSVQERSRASTLEPHPYHWTAAAYYEMAERGQFENSRVELIEGEIVEMSPILAPHSAAVLRTNIELRRLFDGDYFIRAQSAMSCAKDSEPQPDILVVPGPIERFDHANPTTGVLLVEVSDSSLRYDRTVKSSLYARAGIPEYWILNLRERQVETFCKPIRDPDARFAWRYAETKIYAENDPLAPLKLPSKFLVVTTLLPTQLP